eukprot:2617027-Amphidinium_carterae.1
MVLSLCINAVIGRAPKPVDRMSSALEIVAQGEHADHRRTATEVTVGVWLYEVTLWLTWEALGYAEAAQASE